MAAIPIFILVALPLLLFLYGSGYGLDRFPCRRADERFTMLVVSMSGTWSAALVGSAVFGKVLITSYDGDSHAQI